MDNALTPNKIQRLMHLAEDKSFNLYRQVLTNDEIENYTRDQNTSNQTGINCVSSGILDLENIEGFGESDLRSISLSKSSSFSPGEMTGRSTEADTGNKDPGSSRAFEEYGRHSVSIDNITSHMDKQTSEIQNLMRHSIASNYSFHSKKDMTAAEASFILNEGRLPVQQSTQITIQDSMSMTGTNISAYFKNRCPEFRKILGHTDSPERPSITDVSSTAVLAALQGATNNLTKTLDQTLDCVPVKQPREKAVSTNLFPKTEVSLVFAVPKSPNKLVNTVPIGPADSKTVNLNPIQKPINNSAKPMDILFRNVYSTHNMASDDTDYSMENSLSISKIADYLGKESNISVSDMLKLNNHTKQANKKKPLTELQVNILENKDTNKDIYVTHLRDTKSADTASSSGTVNTVISLDKLKISEKDVIPSVTVSQSSMKNQNNDDEVVRRPRITRSKSPSVIPTVTVTQSSMKNQVDDDEVVRRPRITRSKSPSSKSPTTLSTVQENIASFKSGDSPLSMSKVSGDSNASRIPSPSVKYRELDSSVDWDEVLCRKRFTQEGLAKEQWVEVTTGIVQGYVGVSSAVTISVTTLADSWLTARFQFDDTPEVSRNLIIELPRFPILLSPKKTENFTIHITSSIEMERNLPFTMRLKDSSIDGEVEYKGQVEVRFKLPAMRALSCEGKSTLTFQPVPELCSVTKHLVLVSDCPVDLQLELSIDGGEGVFYIKSVQEIKKSDISQVFKERSGRVVHGHVKTKNGSNKQLCRLISENALKVAITFCSPKLADLAMSNRPATLNGALNVAMIGLSTVLLRAALAGAVGSARLAVQPPVGKLQLTSEPTILNLCNNGTITGVWAVKLNCKIGPDGHVPFRVSDIKLEIAPGSVTQLQLMYSGPPDTLNEGTLIFEDTSNGTKAEIQITGGSDGPKTFPIKTNYNNMSWVRSGTKELSLKNSTNQKVQIRCQIMGEGFMLDCPGVKSRETFLLTFGPCECRPLPIFFCPNSCLPHAAALHLVYDKNSDYSRKIKLHGCASNDSVRWSGLMTYGDTALVRAAARADIQLQLFNRAAAPAFLCARVAFNLQYRFLAAEAELAGRRRVLARRAAHRVALRVPWARLERRARAADATALATVSVLTGPEYTRRRILRILKNESNGALDVSLLPENLRMLAEPFEGEDATMDTYLENFNETKASLNELIESLQELTAQIDLPQDWAEDHTILVTEDTVVEHHTLYD